MEKDLFLSIDTALYERFEIALRLNGENIDTAINSLIRKYVSQTFSKEAASYGNQPQNVIKSDDEKYGKAKNKIPKWAIKTEQINHKIVRAYFQLEEIGIPVTYENLQRRCTNREQYPDVYISTFNSNFAQMKSDNGNSHGKVFEVDEKGVITVWETVKGVLLKYKDYFINHD